MEEARKLSEEEKNQSSGEEGSVAERLRKKIVALEAIIAQDRKIAGRKDSNVAETKTSEAVPGANTGESLIRPRFTQSPTRMDEDELDSILPQRGSYRGSVIPEKQENAQPKRPVRYQKPSVVSASNCHRFLSLTSADGSASRNTPGRKRQYARKCKCTTNGV